MRLQTSSVWPAPHFSNTMLPAASLSSASPAPTPLYIGRSELLPSQHHTCTPNVKFDQGLQQVLPQGPTAMDWRFITETDPTGSKDAATVNQSRAHALQNAHRRRQQLQQQQQQQQLQQQNQDEVQPGAPTPKLAGVPRKRAGDPIQPSDQASSSQKRLRITLDEAGNVKRSDVLKLWQKAKSPRARRRNPERRGSMQTSTPGASTPQSTDSEDPEKSLASASTPASNPPSRRGSTFTSNTLSFMNPSPNRYFESRLDPFAALQGPMSPLVNIERLKHDCHKFFSSPAMRLGWLPALLDTRTTFLSSLCVSSIHRDFFVDSITEQSVRTRMIRTEVISQINEILQSSELQASDMAIMSVLQLTTCEIMSGSERDLAWHENGILQMVRLRNGLSELGVGGVLARVLTGIAFVSAICREAQPNQIYLEYSNEIPSHSSVAQGPVIESPLFCPGSDFVTLGNSRQCAAPTLALLRDIRDITDAFLKLEKLENEISLGRIEPDNTVDVFADFTQPDQQQQQQNQERQALLDTISTIHSRTTRNPLPDYTASDLVHESIRLAAIIYTTAIFQRIPLSAAASAASLPDGWSLSLTLSLKRALGMSDLSSCWGRDMTAVLLWVCLVGSAASKGRTERNWIVSVAVRAYVLSTFEHGGAVITGLKRLLGILEGLGRGNFTEEKKDTWWDLDVRNEAFKMLQFRDMGGTDADTDTGDKMGIA